MSRGFELHSKYKPAGDQPKAIEALVDGLESGLAGQTLLGVTGSGKTFTMANVIAEVQRPTLILAHNKTLAAQSFHITITTSQKPTFQVQIPLLRKTRQSMITLSKCDCPPPKR